MDPPPLVIGGFVDNGKIYLKSRSRRNLQRHSRSTSIEAFTTVMPNKSRDTSIEASIDHLTSKGEPKVAKATLKTETMKGKTKKTMAGPVETKERLETMSTKLDVAEAEWTPSLAEVQKRAPYEYANLHPPEALRVRSADWIAVLPFDFYDIWRDDLVSLFASTSSVSSIDSFLDELVEGDLSSGEKLLVMRNRLAISNFNARYPLLKGKVTSATLQHCRSGAIQLVYFSKAKNCPQGYSGIIKA